jgi:nitrogen fixation/metabolism regulation signal transduction histidine kinase
MKRLVNEFRDYARLPSAELNPLDLNGLIQDVMVLYAQEPSETATRAQVTTDLDPTLPMIEGDAQQLRQVVHNLIQNAQDASEAHAKVTLTTRWSPARKRVKLTVTDEGPGFAANILQRAFEPYVTTKAKGTGLGLAVVKKIADEHGARLDIANLLEDGVVKGAQVSLSFSVEKLAQS